MPNTVKQYRKHLKHWCMFCGNNYINYLIASFLAMFAILKALCDEGSRYGSVHFSKSAHVLILGYRRLLK